MSPDVIGRLAASQSECTILSFWADDDDDYDCTNDVIFVATSCSKRKQSCCCCCCRNDHISIRLVVAVLIDVHRARHCCSDCCLCCCCCCLKIAYKIKVSSRLNHQKETDWVVWLCRAEQSTKDIGENLAAMCFTLPFHCCCCLPLSFCVYLCSRLMARGARFLSAAASALPPPPPPPAL